MMQLPITENLGLGRYAGSLENKDSPIHNWFVYRHSFGKTLVSEVLHKLNLDGKAKVLDPFCGCGTTLLVCQHKGIESVGLDLMPLSTVVSRVKTSFYNTTDLTSDFEKIISSWNTNSYPRPDIAVINKAFSQEAWSHIQSLRTLIEACTRPETRDFFITALVSIAPALGSLSTDGGFPRITEAPKLPLEEFKPAFVRRIRSMVAEAQVDSGNGIIPRVAIDDARKSLGNRFGEFSAIICSPPYPNRHDYTRVYTVELATAFVKNNNELKELRKQLFRSHIEVKMNDEENIEDQIQQWQATLEALSHSTVDKRVIVMLKCYFQDIKRTLENLWEVLIPKGTAVMVIGNVRFGGVIVPVDELVALIGEEVGFTVKEITVIRYRGNSPQQMRDFGKARSRESIIILQKGGALWV